jgi:hypothetical protein|nr:hypothetical protein [Kofleriaceae bacterium]
MRTLVIAAIAVLGCGNDDVHHLNDGGGDAAQPADAPATDAPPTPGVVTVTVTLGSVASSGVPVYFQNADSSLVSEAMTDGSGVASATMAPGGFVTVIEPQFPASFVPVDQVVTTFAGVKPGDQLRDDVAPAGTIEAPETFTLTVPTDPNPAVATYTLFSRCGDVDLTPPVSLARKHPAAAAANPPISVAFLACGSAIDMLVQTEDANQNTLDVLFAGNVAIADGSAVAVTGDYAPLNGSAQITVTNVPAEYDEAEYELELGPDGSLFRDNSFFDTSTGSGTTTLPLLPPLTGAIAQSLVELDPTGDITDTQEQASWGPITTSVTADASAFRLASWASFPQVDTVDHSVRWVVTKQGLAPDYVFVDVFDDRADPDNETQDDWDWRIVAPGSEDGHVTYPTLPTDIFDFNFHDTDLELGVGDDMFAATSPGGYDAARPLVFDVIQGFFDPEALPVSTGSIVIQQRADLDARGRVRSHPRGLRHAKRSAAP